MAFCHTNHFIILQNNGRHPNLHYWSGFECYRMQAPLSYNFGLVYHHIVCFIFDEADIRPSYSLKPETGRAKRQQTGQIASFACHLQIAGRHYCATGHLTRCRKPHANVTQRPLPHTTLSTDIRFPYVVTICTK